MILNGELVSWLSHRIKASHMDLGSHEQVQSPVPSYIVSSHDYGQGASFLCISFPPEGIKVIPWIGGWGSVPGAVWGVTSSASWNSASPMPSGYDPKICSRTALHAAQPWEVEGLFLLLTTHKTLSCPLLCISPPGPATAGCISEQH